MSTEIVVALIGLAGVLLAPLVKTWAARRFDSPFPGRALAVGLALLGLLLLAGAGGRLWTATGSRDVVDLGSAWDARDRRVISDLDAGRPFVYTHTPVGPIRYARVVVDDTLVRVTRACGWRRDDITYLFTRIDSPPAERPVYRSAILAVDPGCRIEFTLRSHAGTTAGIDLLAEPAQQD